MLANIKLCQVKFVPYVLVTCTQSLPLFYAQTRKKKKMDKSWFCVLDAFTDWIEISKWWIIQTKIYWALVTHANCACLKGKERRE